MNPDLKEKSDNPVQRDYDDKFNDMTSPDNYAQDGQEPDLHERETKPDKDDGAPLEPWEQAKVDQMDAGLRENDLYEPEGGGAGSNKPLRSRLKGAFSGRKKYGWIGGGVIATLLSLIAIIFPTLGPLHIYNNLFNHNFEYNDSFRRNRTGSIVKAIFNKNRTNRTLADTPFALKADLIEFEKFETRMQSRGWDFDYDANGRAIGLIDPAGQNVDLDGLSRSEFNSRIQPLLDDTVPAWRMNKRVRTRSLISTFTGPRRTFSWSKLFGRDKTAEPDFETAKFKKEAGLDDIDVDGDLTVRSTLEDGGDSPADKALQATVDAKLDGATDAEAIKVGVTEARNSATPDGGRTSIVIGSVALGCIAYSVNANQLSSQFERYAAALRYGATFMLSVNEIQQGEGVSAREIGDLFGEYNNYESTIISTNDLEESVDANGTITYEESENTVDVEYDNNTGTFAEAAAWQRATGKPVTGSELNEEFRVNPTGDPLDLVNGIMGTLSSIGGFLSQIPGFGVICSILNSAVGFLVGIAFDLIEGIAAIAACTTGAGCVALGKFALVELLWEVGSRMIGAALTAFAGFLTDNPAQAAAILDQSLNLTASEETRTAMPIDSGQYNEEVARFERNQNANRSFAERYFDLNNPNSLAMALASAKTAFKPGDLKPTNLITALMKLPGSSLIAALNSENVYAQADLDFDNYGFQKYSFSNAYVDVDPFDNAEEVLQMIEDDDSIYLDSDNGNYARDFAVMCMGYSVDEGEVDKGNLNRNFLPIYSDPKAFPNAQARNDAFQAICIEEANAQPNLYAQIGRFVDDLELVQSIGELSALQN